MVWGVVAGVAVIGGALGVAYWLTTGAEDANGTAPDRIDVHVTGAGPVAAWVTGGKLP